MFNRLKKIALFSGLVAVIPAFALAQSSLGNPNEVLAWILDTLNVVIQILFVLALLYFIWAVISYAFKKDEDREESKKIMINGLIALFVIATVWGLVGILKSIVADKDDPTVCPTDSCVLYGGGNPGVICGTANKCYPVGTVCGTIPSHCQNI